MSAADLATLISFQMNLGSLQRSSIGAIGAATDAKSKIGLLKRSAQEAPVDNGRLVAEAERLDNEIDSILNDLRGGRENTDTPPPSLNDRIGYVAERFPNVKFLKTRAN